MLRYFCTLLFLFCIIVFSNAQKIQSGYIITAAQDTISGTLNVGIMQTVSLKTNGKPQKYEKQDLIDYGEITSNGFKSWFAKTAFKSETKKGCLYFNNGDSLNCFILSHNLDRVKYVLPNKKPEKETVSEITSFNYFDEEKGWKEYTGMSIPRTDLVVVKKSKSKKEPTFSFARILKTGKINLYATSSMSSIMIPDASGIMTYENYKVYLLKKGDQETEMMYRDKLSLQSNEPLKRIVADYPEIAAKIGTKGYKLKNIQSIIEEYNKHWDAK